MKECINMVRQKILLNGYANQKDIQKFLGIGYKKSKHIVDEINNDIEASNKKTLPGVVPARYLLNYLGLTEKKIFEYAEIEKKSLAATSEV